MKVITPELTSSPSTMGMLDFHLDCSHQQLHHLHHQEATTTTTDEFVNVIDFIRGDPHLPERHVFDRKAYPDYSRVTQRRLVAYIQEACERQNSPVSVHQWANEEHDERTVRRIRFRCAFFRKKKRRQGAPCCLFQFQVCYQEKYGWCLLNGKGQHRHNGHALAKTAPAPIKSGRPTNTKSFRSSCHSAIAAKPALKSPVTSTTTTTTSKPVVGSRKRESGMMLKPEPALSSSLSCMSCTPVTCSCSHHHHQPIQVESCAAAAIPVSISSSSSSSSSSSGDEESSWDDSKVGFLSDAPKNQFSTTFQLEPAFTDFAFDNALPMEDMDMDWDFLTEAMCSPMQEEAAAASALAFPSSSEEGLLQKTIHLTETPFPEVASLEDKCAGIIGALQRYAAAHDFAVTLEDHCTADRPDEKTMRVVLHCLGGCNCCYQVALLWVVGRKRWQIYCQPDGIFVHGCSRLEEKASGAVACSKMAMAATPLDQALDFLADFLDGEVVCPDLHQDDEEHLSHNMAASCWKKEEEEHVSENVRQETRKAVAKVATGVDATASAA